MKTYRTRPKARVARLFASPVITIKARADGQTLSLFAKVAQSSGPAKVHTVSFTYGQKKQYRLTAERWVARAKEMSAKA